MNQLLPIVRRVRRPLVVSDAPVAVVGRVEPPSVNAEREAPSAEEQTEEGPAEAGTRNENHASDAATRTAR